MDTPVVIRMRRTAMNCEFELVLCGSDRQYLVDAAEEAFEELARLEAQMSVFVPTSEISEINACAVLRAVRIDARLFDLLQTAGRLSVETNSAFDISAGPLIRRWKAEDGADFSLPTAEEIGRLLLNVGMCHVSLDVTESTVAFDAAGVSLDLGAIGKGFAVGEIAGLLRERGIKSALISGGMSTIYALGRPPDADTWTVGIRHPIERTERIAVVELRDRALSTSGGHERFTEVDEVRYSHVIDPRSGWPVDHLLIASAVTADPIVSEALSTGFLVMGLEETRRFCEARADVGAIVVPKPAAGEKPEVVRIGIDQS